MYKLVLVLWSCSWPAFAASIECLKGEVFVSGHPRDAYIKANGTFVLATVVTEYCRAKSTAQEYWSEKLFDGAIEGWPHKDEKIKKWSRSEIEATLKAFEDVPRVLWQNVRVHRGVRSITPGNLATSASEIIVLYDSAFNRGGALSRYLAHELAHEKFRTMTEIELTTYNRVAGWKAAKTKGKAFRTSRTRFVEADGDLSPEEDFANNVDTYIFDPLKLRVKNPEIYDWFVLEYGDKLKKGAK